MPPEVKMPKKLESEGIFYFRCRALATRFLKRRRSDISKSPSASGELKHALGPRAERLNFYFASRSVGAGVVRDLKTTPSGLE